mmetsp:Transcript_5900/g.14098  ORF Transcript_5900/g.14098 Transcript_5900/m.14098 type:complete len:892 (-) Transcript_5900:2540-5215(-)|eukprot:CAMPEP_0113880708 /NCGR_PEP_ID=MMETSP0780_2-20120614/7942_1 /TAXON_ID=652834 /ORGANISM="Palpitomonas bilix" /LENGTH=891 /DNA_ID=CAMNT_0000867427 /DNA_START=3462 /DNA_END=6137 /DNA_ORIENTATION=+ /assembly_acc=CAM_ASM_000599
MEERGKGGDLLFGDAQQREQQEIQRYAAIRASRTSSVFEIMTLSSSSSEKKVICFYTNKGGVGKTSSLLHMAIRAGQSKRVMLLDCDPQMNTTQFMAKYAPTSAFPSSGAVASGEGTFSFEDVYNGLVQSDERSFLENRNILSLLQAPSMKKGEGYLEYLESMETIGYPITLQESSGIALITSHPLLVRLEELLGDEVGRQFQQTLYTRRLRNVCDYLLRARGYDVVLVDLSPSTSFFNQLMLVQSDYVVMPCTHDAFAQYAIRTMVRWLSFWKEQVRGELQVDPRILSVVYQQRTSPCPDASSSDKEEEADNRTEALHRGLTEAFWYDPDLYVGSLADQLRVPLVKDGQSAHAKLQWCHKTCYDDFDFASSSPFTKEDIAVVEEMKQGYELLWGKMERALGWASLAPHSPPCLPLVPSGEGDRGSFSSSQRNKRKRLSISQESELLTKENPDERDTKSQQESPRKRLYDRETDRERGREGREEQLTERTRETAIETSEITHLQHLKTVRSETLRELTSSPLIDGNPSFGIGPKRVVSFYAHKGGVGKTTLLLNLAVKASLNKRVVVIDCDPQMNASLFLSKYQGRTVFDFDTHFSSLMRHCSVREKSRSDRSPDDREFLQTYDLTHRNVFDLLRASQLRYVSYKEYLDQFPCLGFPITTEADRGLTLVTSHPLLMQHEHELVGPSADQYRSRFRELCDFLLHVHQYDVVFVDLSPSSSPFHQLALVQSDFVVSFCTADEYAHFAVRTFAAWLDVWERALVAHSRHPQIVTVVFNKYEEEAGASAASPPVLSMLDRQHRPTRAHRLYIERLHKTILHFVQSQSPLRRFFHELIISRVEFPLIRHGGKENERLHRQHETYFDGSGTESAKAGSIQEDMLVAWRLLQRALGWK